MNSLWHVSLSRLWNFRQSKCHIFCFFIIYSRTGPNRSGEGAARAVLGRVRVIKAFLEDVSAYNTGIRIEGGENA